MPPSRRSPWPSLLVTIFVLLPGILSAQNQTPHVRVLPDDFNADKSTQMMRSYLRSRVHDALDRRLEKLDALDSADAIRSYQTELRNAFLTAIGPLPDRTPLNAKITGSLERDTFRIEKILFESQPGLYVTGNLYLPHVDGPHPGVLLPCGHSKNGKAYDSYQRAAILLAQNGFVVFCFDPIGQGERHQFLENAPLGSGEHRDLGVAPVLLGRGLATYFIHDGMRALDYLVSRPEVDPERIGCTGNSGGGNLTAMLMALDDRIVAAAPGCFMATTRTKNEKPGPGDAEQNIFGQTRDGLDHPDFAIIRAPKPTLILSATRDYVPIAGAWTNFRQAKQIYTKLGRPEAVELIEAPEPHGFSKLLREGAVRFFARWLQDRHLETVEPGTLPVATDAELQVTPDGEVLMLPGARSLPEINSAYFEKNRTPVPTDPDELRALVRKVTGIRDLTATATATRTAKPLDEKHRRTTLTFTPEPGISLPAYRTSSPEVDSRRPAKHYLLLHDQGIGSTANEAERIIFGKAERRPAHYTILGVDLRDVGETKTSHWRYYGVEATIAYMLGDSYLSMRTSDILAVARFESQLHGGKKIHLHAHGELSAPAMHAAALEPDLFESASFHGGAVWHSWQPLLELRPVPGHIHTLVHGALLHYDLTDLMPLIPNARLLP